MATRTDISGMETRGAQQDPLSPQRTVTALALSLSRPACLSVCSVVSLCVGRLVRTPLFISHAAVELCVPRTALERPNLSPRRRDVCHTRIPGQAPRSSQQWGTKERARGAHSGFGWATNIVATVAEGGEEVRVLPTSLVDCSCSDLPTIAKT